MDRDLLIATKANGLSSMKSVEGLKSLGREPILKGVVCALLEIIEGVK